VLLLHDLVIPGRGNIDHLAIAPSGVWVIDTKRYRGTARIHRTLLGRATLLIAARDQTRLIDGVKRQVALISAILAREQPAVAVHGALCFIDTRLPRRPLRVSGVLLAHPSTIARQLNRRGPLGPEDITQIARVLTPGPRYP